MYNIRPQIFKYLRFYFSLNYIVICKMKDGLVRPSGKCSSCENILTRNPKETVWEVGQEKLMCSALHEECEAKVR